MIKFDGAACQDLEGAKKREWLVVNGIGGYASSTSAGMNTRRYHGLLIAATKPPLGRILMLSQTEDVLIVDGTRFDLSTNLYSSGVVHPCGYKNMSGFRADPDPVFTFAGEGWEVEKSIGMVSGENTTVIEYTLKKCPKGCRISLELRPLIAFRDYHGTTHENGQIDRSVRQTEGRVELQPYADLPKLYLIHTPAIVEAEGSWYRNFEYEEERARGLDFIEDLFNPLVFKCEMAEGKRFSLVASTKPQSIVDFHDSEERTPDPVTREPGRDLIETLTHAAGQFIATREPHMTILAGYHWFGDWGRDTMISLPGLLLTTGRPEIAKEILLEYVRYVDGGMLPNRFPDAGDTPEYNTVDATLWFFEAIRQYVAYQDDSAWRDQAIELLRESLYGPLQSIIAGHLAGTRYGIHADQDVFLWAGDASTQLTWMDAKVGEIAITPRSGRPVEIQALWYNALRTMEHFARLLDDIVAADSFATIAGKLQKNFERVFWNPKTGHLNDVAGEVGHDGSLRPNQIFAVGLHHPLLTSERARSVLEAVERDLLTPFGLRTLSPRDGRYCGRYEGGVWSRDSAYHQGTVWPWLAGPFFFAKLKVSEGSKEATREVVTQIETWLEKFSTHLRDAGLGQISEIFDGDYPHTPRGCIAQAWSVAEILRLAKRVLI